MKLNDIHVLKFLVRSAMFAGLVAIGAFLSFQHPLSPVPITLQTFFVLLAAVFLPPLWASVSMLLYLFAGIIGFPVFAGGTSSFSVILSPTGGFLIGFPFAAFVASFIVRRFKFESRGQGSEVRPWYTTFIQRYGANALALVVGTLVIYLFGIPWMLNVAFNWNWEAGFLAVLPFFPGDILKIIAALLIIPRIRALD